MRKMLTTCLILLACVGVAAPGAAKMRELSKTLFAFPESLPGQLIEVRKVIDPVTGEIGIVSNNDRIRNADDLESLMKEERKAERKKYGAIRGRLRNTFDAMGSREGRDVRVHLKMPVVRYLDKTKHPEDELRRQSKDISKLQPLISVSSVADKYGLDVTQVGKRSFEVNVKKNILGKIMFDDSVASVEEIFEDEGIPCGTPLPFSHFATSAANPPPMQATGHGVNAATFEEGITTDFFNCLGNLDPDKIAIDDTADWHSQRTFLCLYYAAPDANLYHYNYEGFSPSARDFIEDKAIQTASCSQHRFEYGPNLEEFLEMDDFAYRYPYPVFCNPAGNGHYENEVHWQCYNAISVGAVRPAQDDGGTHYELVAEYSTRTRNPEPIYGFYCINEGDPCAGDREMPHIVAPGIFPVEGLADDCLDGGLYYWGTSYAAPTVNGMVASVISSDSRMVSWPEKVRVALLLTAHNLEEGDWRRNVDGRDGTGVVSGSDAIRFAQGHLPVRPDNSAVEYGLHASSWGRNDMLDRDFHIRVPNPKPSGKHLRMLLTWDSNPDVNGGMNHLSDLDIVFYGNGNSTESSLSYDSNVEVLDIASDDLTAGGSYLVSVKPFILRIPEDVGADYFYWAVGWTWVRDHAD